MVGIWHTWSLVIPGEFPCSMFPPRNYNASSVERIGAGKNLAVADFNPQKFNQTVGKLIASGAAAKAGQAGAELASLGGAAKVLDVLENRFGQ